MGKKSNIICLRLTDAELKMVGDLLKTLSYHETHSDVIREAIMMYYYWVKNGLLPDIEKLRKKDG